MNNGGARNGENIILKQDVKERTLKYIFCTITVLQIKTEIIEKIRSKFVKKLITWHCAGVCVWLAESLSNGK